MAKKVSKIEKVRDYLENECGGITQREAVEMFNAWRLSAIIHDLREECNIKTVMEKNREGGTHARYYMLTGNTTKCPCCGTKFDIGEASSRGDEDIVGCPNCDTEFDWQDPDGESISYDEWIDELNRGYMRDRGIF